MLRILYLIWPAAIPIALFLLWYAWQYRRAKKEPQKAMPTFKQSPWFITLIATIIIAIVSLFAIVLSEEGVKGEYKPATFEDGTLNDGKITPQ